MMKKTIYKIKGMECTSCAAMIELDLEDAGIEAKCSYANETLEIYGEHDKNKVAKTVSRTGYDISEF